MQVLRDIVENAAGVVDSINDNFKTSRPFQAGTLSVYIDGQLRVAAAPDGWIEIDPATGAFQTRVPPTVGSAVQCSYTDADTKPLIHPLMPLNIADVQAPITVRIQLVSGYVFAPIGMGMVEITKNCRPRAYLKSLIVGRLLQNDFQNRRLQVEYQDTTFPNEHLTATVMYKQIRYIEKQIDGTYVSDKVHRLRIPQYVQILGIF
jgi:hypothetical protein